jgi:membrane-bound lytic murein transglycosylase B
MTMNMLRAMCFILVTVFALQVSPCFALSENDFQIIGRMYGVSPHVLQAIALVESQHGELLGKYTVSEVVDRTQLKYLRKIAQHTGQEVDAFKGSYRGAMGYMQIMPATFYTFAQDGDGDGIRDPLNPHDSLATAAHYLARSIATTSGLRAALKKYNNSNAYCDKVLALSSQIETESNVTAQVVVTPR